MNEKEFLEFYSGFYGEKVDNLKQIGLSSFNGEELFEFVCTAVYSHNIKYLPKENVKEPCSNLCHSGLIKWIGVCPTCKSQNIV